MERAQRLYDCITEIGDSYLQAAEQFQPQAPSTAVFHWRRWGALAAAILLVVGVSRMSRMGSAEKASSGNEATPAASAPCASESIPAEAAAEGTQSSGSWEAQLGGDYPSCTSYQELAQVSDVIVEGTVTAVTPDVELDISEESAPARYMTFTVIELEVSDVLKGNAEVGKTIQLKYLQTGIGAAEDWNAVSAREGEQNIYFLADYRDDRPDMPCSLINPSQAVVHIDGDTVLADGGMLDREEQDVSMDKEDFKDLIRQALEEE